MNNAITQADVSDHDLYGDANITGFALPALDADGWPAELPPTSDELERLYVASMQDAPAARWQDFSNPQPGDIYSAVVTERTHAMNMGAITVETSDGNPVIFMDLASVFADCPVGTTGTLVRELDKWTFSRDRNATDELMDRHDAECAAYEQARLQRLAATRFHAQASLDGGEWVDSGDFSTVAEARLTVEHARYWRIANDDGKIIETSETPERFRKWDAIPEPIQINREVAKLNPAAWLSQA